ncbi:MAG: HK97 family phage prohead protease [Lachnospiraceae bacterium]|nr:HK97 family phage prohead protease [Lachnospiraceae bacterium]
MPGTKKNNEAPEKRNFSFEVRAAEDEKGKYIEGRPIVYESPTDICGLFRETIKRGALDKANLKDVRFLVNHDTRKIPLARSRNNNENSTMRLMPDGKGLKIRVNLDVENNTEARALYSAVSRGDISGMSFAFNVREEEWNDKNKDYPEREIRQIEEVFEVSAVTFPAYESTEIYTRSKETLNKARKTLESVQGGEEPDGTKPQDTLLDSDVIEILKQKNRILGGL